MSAAEDDPERSTDDPRAAGDQGASGPRRGGSDAAADDLPAPPRAGDSGGSGSEDGDGSDGDGKPKRPRLSRARLGHVFRTLIWPRRGLLLIGLALIVVNRLTSLVLPWSTQVLVDEVITPGNLDVLPGLLWAVGGAILVQAVSSFLLTRLLSVEAQLLIAHLRARLQAHVLGLPTGYYDRAKSGALVSRIMSDVEGVRNLIGTGLVQLIGGALSSVVAFVLLLRIDAVLTSLTLLPLLTFGLVALKAFAVIRPIFRERSKIQAEVTGRLTETLGGIRVVKGFAAEEGERGVFESGVLRLFDNVRRTLTANALVTSLATLLLGIVSVAVMGVGAQRAVSGELTTGDLFAFTLLLGYLVGPIVQMAAIGTQITEAFAGLDRMEELLAEPREDDDPARTLALERVDGAITFEDVSFAYAEGPPVLHDVSLTAAPGTVTALVGSSGSGKSTLAGLAASFLQPTAGRVRVDGQDLAAVRLASYRRHLGVVLQDDFLFEGTIRENVRFARPDASEAELLDAVAAAHVDAFTDQMKDGLDTIVGERGIKLSGGQRQRVSIARALLADPRVLILDEATSSLDAESESYVQVSLETLMAGRTTFVIAHRLSTIRRADQILVLEEGRIVERGDHAELMARGGRYHDLATLQARI